MSLNEKNQVENYTATEVNHVAVKLPPFISDDAEMWLQVVDSVTSEETKFNYPITALDRNVMSEVSDLVMNPPQDKPYSALRAALIRRLSTSQEQKTRRLLEREEIGDSKPSQFLRRLKALAASTVSDSLLRTLWIGRLLSSVQAILATQKNAALDDVAELADAVMEIVMPGTALQEVARSSPEDDRLNRIEQQLVEMSQAMAKLFAKSEPRRPTTRTPRSRSQNRSRSRDSDSAWKEDIQATAAEMVYGQHLRLPGEFLYSRRTIDEEFSTEANFVKDLRRHMESLRPAAVKRHGDKTPFVIKDLATATRVFVRADGVKTQLQNLYDGPFTVIKRDDKTFTVLVRGRKVKVSIDRVKPAYCLNDATAAGDEDNSLPSTSAPLSVPTTPKAITIRSG
ncbi:uncharacterized protein LOC108904497 [Anoplophora glabripennis]|uniref:uncharacterized protein LOC108904497 n=1 Tax=Anoplophora glabripennis TaxID=217634 RepID=UPI000874897F|nr:uncharacterized protein LOC108904497 [Anoplophora glabripennis]